MHKRVRGFTLIELLVVIAIIALLMGILMPALSRVKKQARAVACQALLKQWGTIWSMYCDDNDGRFPEAGDLGWKRGTWVIAFRDTYRTKSEMVLCPSAVKRRATGTTGVQAWGDSTHSYIQGSGGIFNSQEVASFGGNNWTYYARDPSGTGNIQGRPIRWNWKTKDTANSTNIPIFLDAMWRGGGPCYRTSDGGSLNPSFQRIVPPQFDGQWLGYGNEMMHFALKRHQTGINSLFLDWSVRAVGLKELWTLKWHRQYPINGPLTKAGGVQPSDWPDWMTSFKDY